MNEIQALKNATSFPIALVVSDFNVEITQELKAGALRRLKSLGFQDKDILVLHVPGAVEIPLAAKRVAMLGQFEVIIALGAVIRGETSHYDYVCDQVSIGCQRVALDYDLPVLFGVLTTEDEAQAWERLGGKHGHNGERVVDSAVAMHTVLHQVALLNTL